MKWYNSYHEIALDPKPLNAVLTHKLSAMEQLTLTTYLLFLPLMVVVCFVYVYCKRQFTYWENRGVYVPFQPKIIFGNSQPLLTQKRTVRDIFTKMYEQCRRNSSKIGGFYFFTKPCLLICDLDLIKAIMKSDFEYFTDRHFHNHESDPLSEHLASMKGEMWKMMRMKLSPAFTAAKSKMMFSIVDNYLGELIDVIKAASTSDVVEIRDLVDRFTINVIGSCAFGIDCNCLKNPNSDFEYYAKQFFSPSIKNSLILLLACLWPSALAVVKVRSIRKDIGEFFQKIVSETIKFREENGVIRKDLMHLLIQVRNNIRIDEDEGEVLKGSDGAKPLLTEANVTAQSIVFFVGGYDTTAITISFCLYELAINPHIQAKARREVLETLAKHDQEFCYDAVNAMVYIEMCINETLRKYAPPPLHLRECTAEYTIPGTNIIIGKGTPIFVPLHGIHMDPEFFPNPELFDPERFTSESIAARHPCSWTPFGFGPRICIGRKFATTETKACIAKLLLNFEFSTSSVTDIPVKINPRSMLTDCQNGIRLSVKPIN